MTSREFCFWLQGHLEIRSAVGTSPPPEGLSPLQVECIRRHLALVFLHEIDPSEGDAEQQAKLNEAHEPKKPAPDANPHFTRPPKPGEPVMRC